MPRRAARGVGTRHAGHAGTARCLWPADRAFARLVGAVAGPRFHSGAGRRPHRPAAPCRHARNGGRRAGRTPRRTGRGRPARTAPAAATGRDRRHRPGRAGHDHDQGVQGHAVRKTGHPRLQRRTDKGRGARPSEPAGRGRGAPHRRHPDDHHLDRDPRNLVPDPAAGRCRRPDRPDRPAGRRSDRRRPANPADRAGRRRIPHPPTVPGRAAHPAAAPGQPAGASPRPSPAIAAASPTGSIPARPMSTASTRSGWRPPHGNRAPTLRPRTPTRPPPSPSISRCSAMSPSAGWNSRSSTPTGPPTRATWASSISASGPRCGAISSPRRIATAPAPRGPPCSTACNPTV
ncbi:hypothetical protein EV662_10869 [Rhodovulum marinum]|uniref:Uncharacterized protein n=1 Tax=Rhodovulum marinum TaxID=320662 RepID=A0A4R2Q0P9_9RHOB|nr:hypothetical protein EV662_10869 [Rhodovulum marinum]